MIVQERRRKPRRYRETAEQPWTRAAANRGVSSPPSPKILLSAYCGYLEQVRTRRKGRGNAFSRAKRFEPAGIMLLLALRNSVNGTQSVSMNNQQFGFKIMCRYHIERETPRET
ncbi:PREDICTED: uncharacterized protein LOC105142938 isoform X1 [Acromyrmex echinatior]|uniref:uncharacterized protein LOC105142938 isoform X1 n=1 Tax=Acromyrmex echinatior TaxID=103372 RepID=UPI000580D9FC|nr:PREDICTED: uncharacterized protein LOC105142938 isoform X1 [Acromyrmex echinatior]